MDATALLTKCKPWDFVAPVKKSQVHHAIVDMITPVLTPLVWSDRPHCLNNLSEDALKPWYDAVKDMKKEAFDWMSKDAKHQPVSDERVGLLSPLT